jgi:hypothetical protein
MTIIFEYGGLHCCVSQQLLSHCGLDLSVENLKDNHIFWHRSRSSRFLAKPEGL